VLPVVLEPPEPHATAKTASTAIMRYSATFFMSSPLKGIFYIASMIVWKRVWLAASPFKNGISLFQTPSK